MRLTIEIELPDAKADLFRQILENLSFVQAIRQTTETEQDFPDWQQELVGQRLAAYEADPANTVSWGQLQKEIQERYHF